MLRYCKSLEACFVFIMGGLNDENDENHRMNKLLLLNYGFIFKYDDV